MGVALKSKLPCNEVYADNDGCRRDDRSRFKVSEHCVIKRSHSLRGNCVSHMHNPVIR